MILRRSFRNLAGLCWMLSLGAGCGDNDPRLEDVAEDLTTMMPPPDMVSGDQGSGSVSCGAAQGLPGQLLKGSAVATALCVDFSKVMTQAALPGGNWDLPTSMNCLKGFFFDTTTKMLVADDTNNDNPLCTFQLPSLAIPMDVRKILVSIIHTAQITVDSQHIQIKSLDGPDSQTYILGSGTKITSARAVFEFTKPKNRTDFIGTFQADNGSLKGKNPVWKIESIAVLGLQ